MSAEVSKASEILIFVPEAGDTVFPSDDPAVERHSIGSIIPVFNRISKVSAVDIQDQWSRTVETLVNFSSNIAGKANDWVVDEIEVGLTLSAKGELLFIAEAGAEASIKLKLKRRPTV